MFYLAQAIIAMTNGMGADVYITKRSMHRLQFMQAATVNPLFLTTGTKRVRANHWKK